MTLKEAFEIWSAAPRNMSLANRYRTAVTTVLMKQYANTELSAVDEQFARAIFAGSDAAQELKSRAASVLVYLLQWGGDHGHCQRPSFDFSIVSDTLSPDAICQLDPGTLKVIKTWRNPFRIQKELGIGNIVRAIERCGLAGGFYWSYGRDVDTFRKRLEAKKRHNHEVHLAAAKRMQAARSKEEEGTEGTGSSCDVQPASDAPQVSVPDVVDGSKRQSPAQPAPTEDGSTETPSPDPGGKPAAGDPRRSRASQALEVFTDRELFAELERRGWHGLFSRTGVMVIGSAPKSPSDGEPGMSAGEWLEKHMPFQPHGDVW